MGARNDDTAEFLKHFEYGRAISQPVEYAQRKGSRTIVARWSAAGETK